MCSQCYLLQDMRLLKWDYIIIANEMCIARFLNSRFSICPFFYRLNYIEARVPGLQQFIVMKNLSIIFGRDCNIRWESNNTLMGNVHIIQFNVCRKINKRIEAVAVYKINLYFKYTLCIFVGIGIVIGKQEKGNLNNLVAY